MSKRFLLFGADGQVGWELQRAFAPFGEVRALTRAEVDLADVTALRAAIHAARPDVILNAAAYTAVDKAEAEPEVARAVNATAPAIMAEEAKALGAWLIHYSTDYVFDGSNTAAYTEADAAKPLSVYGRSKREGEQAIAAAGASHLILRTSWVFGPHGGNFLKTMLRLAREREELSVVADQVGAPTSAELLADVTTHALRAALAGRLDGGLYHFAAAGATSWHGYASFVAGEARRLGVETKLAPERIKAIPTEQYPLPAPRPKNSRLDCSRISQALDLDLPDWQWHVRRTLKELLQP
ncbi:MAG: dTDP-4-dehydrorhamnose reductase [Gammaproteobacteria bacterium]|nr:dTDP-4-dehydrorhamnose reductase [Gammaproteobacteria bacterium]MBU1647611.1 dTDP-4-dehydrorhamnose reductase [Gammaproteobacteria bacterium]MBU1971500.1 dTDP-4-dehydrorhamnose reductase [Gammaproteobacteria bacterium]